MSPLIIPSFQTFRVLVCGDVMLDRYWYGDTTRISPEAPVPVVHVANTESRAGGSANVALNLAALGVQASVLGLIGDDQEGRQLTSLLETKGIECHFKVIADYPTITKLRVLGRDQQLIRMDFEKGFHGLKDQVLSNEFERAIQQVDAVIFSDYAKGALTHVEQLIAIAKKYNVPILVDPKTHDFSCYSGASVITPNRKEFENVVGPCHSMDEIKIKAGTYLKTLNIEALLVTLGKEGMLLVCTDAEPLHLPTQARDVYDVTGAGDTVIATLAAALAANQSLGNAARLANAAAGIVVAKLGTSTVSPAELRRSLRSMSGLNNVVLDEAACLQAVNDAREQGETIVMTNGCFDILHAGHVQYLEQAKSFADRLVVAVNDDASVARLKGVTRPYNSLEQRMSVLAGLRSVDWVVSFSEDTPARLIESVLPDVLVKGGDYRPEEIAGRSAVIEKGGRVEVVEFLERCSTTRLVERILKREAVVS